MQIEPDMRQLQSVYLKDVLLDKRMYIDMARKMADLYEEMLDKHSLLKATIDKIF